MNKQCSNWLKFVNVLLNANSFFKIVKEGVDNKNRCGIIISKLTISLLIIWSVLQVGKEAYI